jgi:glucose-6-phosphate isomerase
MGGSSLAAEVMRQTFGVLPGFPNLMVLDTTDPQAIRLATESIDLANTLFIVSTKSGSTTETLALYRYYYHLVAAERGDPAGQQFIAITDAGSMLETIARDHGFWRVFLNPEDIGGRYSVLSYFGLVAAAVMGLDLDRLIASAPRQTACERHIPTRRTPAVVGRMLGALAQQGRDKVCIVATPGSPASASGRNNWLRRAPAKKAKASSRWRALFRTTCAILTTIRCSLLRLTARLPRSTARSAT